jgi:hypothetical protein
MQMLKQVPPMRLEFLNIVNSDPDPVRRSKAAEILNWAGNSVDTTYQLIPALDDSSAQVRASVARFINPRVNMLPPNFPFPDLVERFSHQLGRQSYTDRLLGLRCLLALAIAQPESIPAIREQDETAIRAIESATILPNIKALTSQLLKLCTAPPSTRQAVPPTEF